MKRIKDCFDDHFSDWGIALSQVELDRHDPARVGRLCRAGWSIRYRFGGQDGMWFMDFYANPRMTNDRHIRIWEDGHSDGLPSPAAFRVLTGNPEEDARREEEYQRRDRELAADLAKKGFIFTGREYLSAHVGWLSRLNREEDAALLRALYGEGTATPARE